MLGAMSLVTIDDIRAAARRIEAHVLRTPLLPAAWAGELWLKPENLQSIGAFKIRGAMNAVSKLDPTTRGRGVITHSSGNHGQALAMAARAYGVPATVVAPESAPRIKIDAMRARGAEVVLVRPAERESAMAELAEQSGATIIRPFDNLDVIAGQGTIGLEIAADFAAVDAVLVPAGGGGLLSGVAVALKALAPGVSVIGVEPELAGDLAEGFAKGERIVWDIERTSRTIADGVRVGVGELTWPHIQAYADDVVTVSEQAILEATGLLARQSHLVAEPSGALTVAAYLAQPEQFGKCVVVVSGGNIDPALLAEVVT